MRYRTKAAVVPILLALTLAAAACAGNRSPQTVAHYGAVNGTIIVDAVDKVQDFIIAEEKAGHVPTDQAVVAMKAIGKALEEAKKAPPLLKKLANLQVGSAEADPLVLQVRAVLVAVSSEAGKALIPISDAAVRDKIGALLEGVVRAIDVIYGWLAKGGVA